MTACVYIPPSVLEALESPDSSGPTNAASPKSKTKKKNVDKSKSSAAKPKASAAPRPDDRMSFSWTDSFGYKFHMDLDPSPIKFTVDTKNQPPGRALIEMRGSVKYSVKNEIPDRNTEFTPPFVRGSAHLYPVFSAEKAPFCKNYSGFPGPEPLRVGKLPSDKAKNRKDLSYCFLNVDFIMTFWLREIGPGKSYQDEAKWTYRLYVAEKDLSAVKASLASPSFWVMSTLIDTLDVKANGVCLTGDGWASAVAVMSEGGKGVCKTLNTYYRVK